MSNTKWVIVAVCGVVLGWFLGSSAGVSSPQPSPEHETAPPRHPGTAPTLDGSAALGRENGRLRALLAERESEIAELRARAALPTEPTAPAGPSAGEMALGLRNHRFSDPGVNRNDFATLARVASTHTGQFEQFVTALPEQDVTTYLDAVWTVRLDVMRQSSIPLSMEEQEKLRATFKEAWLDLRKWARSDFQAALGKIETPQQLQDARILWSTRMSETFSRLNQSALRVLGSGERLAEVSRFL